jgi:hypothetical protein
MIKIPLAGLDFLIAWVLLTVSFLEYFLKDRNRRILFFLGAFCSLERDRWMMGGEQLRN